MVAEVYVLSAPKPAQRLGPTSLSVAAHAVAGVVVFFSLRMHPVQVFSLPGTDLGTRVELTYLPGRAPAPAPHPQTKVKPKAGFQALSNSSGGQRHRTPSIFRHCRTLRSLRLRPPPMFPPPHPLRRTRTAAPTPGARARSR